MMNAKGMAKATCALMAPAMAVCLALPLAGEGEKSVEQASEVFVVNDDGLRRSFEQGMAKIINADEHRKFEELQSELKRKSCDLDLPVAGDEVESPEELYARHRGAVVMISTFFRCPDPECKYWHSNIATGFLIHPDGIVVTNHHILGSPQAGSKALGVQTLDGRVHAVAEVLAADRKNDVAILRLATEEGGFPYVTLGIDLPAGRDVMVISHPDKDFYSLTRGSVSRHYIDSYTKARTMSITADFGKGSSGGPVFGADGKVAGMVVSTRSLAYNSLRVLVDPESECLRKATPKEINDRNVDDDQRPKRLGFGHQMTFKQCVPVSAIRKLIK